MGSVASFHPAEQLSPGLCGFLYAINTDTEDQPERRWKRKRNENNATQGREQGEREKEMRAKEIAGRARVETRKKDVEGGRGEE